MERVLMTASALALMTSAAVAGGIERSSQSAAVLFESGRYAELSFGAFRPDVSGSVAGGLLPSGDMALGYGTVSLSYKQDLTDRLAIAIVLEPQFGADLHYPAANAPYPLAGSLASVDSETLTGFLKYRFPNNVSVFGGVRATQTSGQVELPTVANYKMYTSDELNFGYAVGVAWEKPEIAARVALTYNSAIKHTLNATESSLLTGGLPILTTFETTLPQSVNLEFQTGIAKNTLLIGSIRWVDWTAFDITPTHYATGLGQGALVSYTSDTVSYNLGVGRKFNDTWSGVVMLGYEPQVGGTTGNLGPTDGYKSIAVAAIYSHDNMKITGGIRYVEIGDAVTNPPISARFTNNSGVGVGFKIGYTF